MEKTLTTAEIASKMGVTRRTVIRWIEAGRFPRAYRVKRQGRRPWHVPERDVVALANEKGLVPALPPAGLVVIVPDEGDLSDKPVQLRAATYRVRPLTLLALQCWLDCEPPLDDSIPPFSERLEDLFRIITRPDGKPHTQREIARRAGLSENYVGRILAGKGCSRNPEYDTILSLAKAFDVSPAHFFVRENRFAWEARARQMLTQGRI